MMDLLARYKEAVLLLTVVVWCSTWRGHRPVWWPWLGAQLCLALVVELVSKWMGAHGIPNHLVYNVYLVSEVVLNIGFILRTLPVRTRANRAIAVASIVVFCLVFIWDLQAHGTWRVFASNALIIGGFIVGVFATLSLFTMARSGTGALHRQPAFWALLSLLVYFFCVTPVWGLHNYFSKTNEVLAVRIYSINDILFVLRYALVLIGLLILRRASRVRP